MPHVIGKLWPGKTERQKMQLANEISHSVMDTLQYGPESVSVAFKEIPAKDWLRRFIQQTSSGTKTSCTRSPASPYERLAICEAKEKFKP